MKKQREILEKKIKQEIHILIGAIDKNPRDWRNYNDLAILLTKMGNYPEAEELLMKSFGQVEKNDNNGHENLQYTLGTVYYSAGKYQKAWGIFNQLTDADLKGEALIMLAQTMQQMGDFQHGLVYAITALEINPNDVALNNLIADMLLALGDFKQAQTYYQKVLNLDAKNSIALFGSGLVALVLGQDSQDYFKTLKQSDIEYFTKNKQRVDDLIKMINQKS